MNFCDVALNAVVFMLLRAFLLLAVLTGVLVCVCRENPSFRHRLTTLTLSLCLLFPVVACFGIPGPLEFHPDRVLAAPFGFSASKPLPADWPAAQVAILAIYATGVFVLLAKMASDLLALGRMQRLAVAADDDRAGEIRSCLAEAGVEHRSIGFFQSPSCRVPFTWGLFRARIVLPPDWQQWPGPIRHMTLLHELSHIKRRDFARQLLFMLVRALHWPNPLIWLVVSRARRDGEWAVDQMVLAMGRPPRDYAMALVGIARLAGVARTNPLAAAAFGSSLAWRVEKILKTRCGGNRGSPAARVSALTAVVTIATVVSAFSTARPDPMLVQRDSVSQGRDGKTPFRLVGGEMVYWAETDKVRGLDLMVFESPDGEQLRFRRVHSGPPGR